MGRVQLTFRSDLGAPPERVWSWITSVDGISRELWPLLKMTTPPDVPDIRAISREAGQPLFRSWVLLFGIIPIDRSDLTLLSLDDGRGFVEQSPMLSMRLWRHERTLEAEEPGSRLTDILTFEPRFAPSLVTWFIRTVFTHRHAVLRKHLAGGE